MVQIDYKHFDRCSSLMGFVFGKNLERNWNKREGMRKIKKTKNRF